MGALRDLRSEELEIHCCNDEVAVGCDLCARLLGRRLC